MDRWEAVVCTLPSTILSSPDRVGVVVVVITHRRHQVADTTTLSVRVVQLVDIREVPVWAADLQIHSEALVMAISYDESDLEYKCLDELGCCLAAIMILADYEEYEKVELMKGMHFNSYVLMQAFTPNLVC